MSGGHRKNYGDADRRPNVRGILEIIFGRQYKTLMEWPTMKRALALPEPMYRNWLSNRVLGKQTSAKVVQKLAGSGEKIATQSKQIFNRAVEGNSELAKRRQEAQRQADLATSKAKEATRLETLAESLEQDQKDMEAIETNIAESETSIETSNKKIEETTERINQIEAAMKQKGVKIDPMSVSNQTDAGQTNGTLQPVQGSIDESKQKGVQIDPMPVSEITSYEADGKPSPSEGNRNSNNTMNRIRGVQTQPANNTTV